MKGFLAQMFTAALAAAWPADAQPQGRPQGRPQQQGMQPQKSGNERQEFRRERFERVPWKLSLHCPFSHENVDHRRI